jgi:single-stranded-DNA-specific exonuclease
MSARRLELAPYDLEAALALERELGVSHVLAQALVRRGFGEPEAARGYLAADESHPADAFAGIEHALETITRHLRAGTRITVHGDYDVDGVCATAIMLRSLRTLGADVDWFLPDRIEDGYGLSVDTVARLAARGTRLLITVDCAITAVDEVARARAAGLDVVVSDHHHPRRDGRLPDCPLVHPAVCGYPCPELCGAAVAYKLSQALGAPGVDAELELVALATVADLMPLRGENRRLVRQGLGALASTPRPGLRALMAVARVDPSSLDASALGFRLAPRINAAGRLRRADAGVELLMTEDPERALAIAAELDRLNAERRAVEQRIAWEAEAALEQLGERGAYVLAAEGWHPGVIGIVASRIAERTHRPAILVALEGAEGTGSGRSIPGFDLLGALDATGHHLTRYGGHRAAAGLVIARERLEAFADELDAYARATLTADLLTPAETVDAVVSGSELGLGLAEELERLEPTGIGNPPVRLLLPGARLRDVRPLGREGRHVRFTVHAGGVRTPAVAFSCGGRLGLPADEPANATFRLERDCWNGAVAPRLVLRHAWGCAPKPIRVVGERERYLEAVLDELERAVAPDARRPPDGRRTVLDRRGESPLAVLADAVAAGGEVLALCAEVSRRLGGLRERTGGFSLASYHALERDPGLAAGARQLVALDPPSCPEQAELIHHGTGFAHLAWGEAELRFAQRMHELEYRLRPSLVALYRALRPRGQAAGRELEALLREGRPGRPARLAARLVGVLAELGLARFEPGPPLLAVAGEAPTALERSALYRFCAKRHEDGRRYLSSQTLLPGA